MSYRNPVIPGFYSDPSICRVGEDFYLATSSFDYFPGVPLWHSRDLINWRQIGHALHLSQQIDLREAKTGQGIYAPTLRHHDGLFYMITTNVSLPEMRPGFGHFYVTAKDPAGSWSQPVWVEGPGFDPDLFFDEDGKVYFCREDIFCGGIWLWEIDIATGKLLGEERKILNGFEDELIEGPHLYKIDGTYYLLAAEGGTHKGHMIVIARAEKPQGPYEPCPHNPILTHRCRVRHPIQATGHGDLVQAPDGSWWIVFLAIRPAPSTGVHHLGRETFLAPVTWEAGWPVINQGQAVNLEMEQAPKLNRHPWPEPPQRDDFDADTLGLDWNFRRNPEPTAYSLSEKPGSLVLHGLPGSLDTPHPVAFVGRRQRHFHCQASTLIDFHPQKENEEAGIATVMNEQHHYALAITLHKGKRALLLRRRIGDLRCVVARDPLPEGELELRISADDGKYRFAWREPDGTWKEVGTASTRYLSTEVAGGFTGIYLAMYATGNGKRSEASAAFDWFDYAVTE